MDDHWSDVRNGIDKGRFGDLGLHSLRRKPRTKRPTNAQKLAKRIGRAKTLVKRWPHCYWCGKCLTSDMASVEHIVPMSEGGKNKMSNIGVSCKRYNSERGLMYFHPDRVVKMCQKPDDFAGFRNREDWKRRNQENDMSYCRFSSDNFKSEVYATGTDNGFEIHIAGMRMIGVDVLPQSIPEPDLDSVSDSEYDKWFDEDVAITARQLKLMKSMKKEAIDLLYAGNCVTVDTHEEFLEKLLELREVGYRVPQEAIDRVEEEIRNGSD